MGERIRGRAGQALRKRRLAMFPFCVECAKRSLVRATDVIDHIVELAKGGEDVDENCQGLCHMCHAIKTAMEASSAEAVSNHPDWLRHAVRKLMIVCGPPCSGKTTYVAERAAASHVVIDLDQIVLRLRPTYRQWIDPLEPALLNRALRIRNELLGSLSNRPGRSAWFVVTAATHSERLWWQSKLGGSIVLLQPPLAVCKQRALDRGTPGALAAIDRWFEQSRQSWRPSKRKRLPRQAIGDDGYPLED